MNSAAINKLNTVFRPPHLHFQKGQTAIPKERQNTTCTHVLLRSELQCLEKNKLEKKNQPNNIVSTKPSYPSRAKFSSRQMVTVEGIAQTEKSIFKRSNEEMNLTVRRNDIGVQSRSPQLADLS
jgi:hypothetical protein